MNNTKGAIVDLGKMNVVLMIGAGLLLAACSSGGDGGGTSPVASVPQLKGVIVDSPIDGLNYSSAPSGLSGVTDSTGHFNYRASDTVTFSLGGKTLGSIPAAPQVTLLTLLGATTVTDPRVVNLAQLLQTLDTNPDPNVITLPSQAQLPDLQINDFSSPTFDPDMAIILGKPLVSEGAAIAELQTQLTALGSAAWGGWVLGSSSDPTELLVIFAFPNGNYMTSVHAPNTNPPDFNISGIESGAWNWDTLTGALTAAVAVNTDSQSGFSGVVGPTSVSIEADTMTMTRPQDVPVIISLSRLVTTANPIVGAWYGYKTDEPGVPPISIAFFEDGTYMHAEDGTSGNGQPGMERGTYQWNQTTTCFVSTTTTVDTNLEHGLSHTQNKNSSLTQPCSETLVIEGDTLTHISAEGAFSLTRLRTP
jgi:hypothetical protein